MIKKEKGKKVRTEKDLEQLAKEIAQKGTEIEQLRKTMEEIQTQIQEKGKAGETEELSKAFDDVSELVDVGFSIFGASNKAQGEKSKSKGLIGLINDLTKLAEKSQTYHRKINLGNKAVVDFRVNSRPIKGSFATRSPSSLKISSLRKDTSQERDTIPPTINPIKEKEPIIDVFEEEERIIVMAELPGVKKSEIQLDAEDNVLTISTDTSERKYFKKVELPHQVKREPVESNYRNGILEVKLRKIEKHV